MLQYLPVGVGKHNVRKLATLQLLSFRSLDKEHKWLTAGEISHLLELSSEERDSLYVLIERWTSWRLLDRRHRIRREDAESYQLPGGFFEYCLAGRGVRWLLRMAPRVELKAAIPRGNVSRVVAQLYGMGCWFGVHRDHSWRQSNLPYGRVYLITAPFQKTTDFKRLDVTRHIPSKPIRIRGYRFLIKADDAWDACEKIRTVFDMQYSREFLTAVVEADVGVEWK